MWSLLQMTLFIVYVSAVNGCWPQNKMDTVRDPANTEVEKKKYFRIMVKSSSPLNKPEYERNKQSDSVTEFHFTAGEMLEFTCITSEKTDPPLQWKINYDLKTEIGTDKRHDKIRLLMRPFQEDSGARISCHSGFQYITLLLIRDTLKNSIGNETQRENRLIEKGSQVYTSDICPTTKHSPNLAMVKVKGKPTTQSFPNHIITKNFTSNDNGTEIDCQYLSYRNYTEQNHEEVPTFERERTITCLYLNEKINVIINGLVNTDLGFTDPTVRAPGESINAPSDGPNIIVIAGSLGAVLFLLILLIILIICFRKKRRPTLNDGDTVVYAEIQERPPQLPPPRNPDPPYATIIGTLVPKPNTDDENIYSM